jgi:homoserine dehydrogenase
MNPPVKPTMKHRIAVLGFGTVGQGLCEILRDKREQLSAAYGFEAVVVAVSDMRMGTVACDEGLDIDTLLRLVQSGASLEDCPGDICRGGDALSTIESCNADSICELTFTDVKTGEPATSHCRAALSRGMNVLTSNKGPAALFYRELMELGREHGAHFGIEGTVMSGTPVLNLARLTLAGNQITAARGILNGTTNYMLSEMESGKSYDEALATAQELGYAEADPTADVDGLDALAKVTILANVLMGEDLRPSDIPCEGIRGITPTDIEEARAEGKRYKLIGEVSREGDKITARVAPMRVELTHPLAGVMGATNAVTFSCDLMGDVTINGAGAGRIETGFSLLVDLLEIHRSTLHRSEATA